MKIRTAILAFTALAASCGYVQHHDAAPTDLRVDKCAEVAVDTIDTLRGACGSHVWSAENGDGPVFAYSQEEDARLWTTRACANSHSPY